MTQSKYTKAFTLLEILLVVAAIAILATIIILAINPNKQLGDTRNAKRNVDKNSIYNAIVQYQIDYGTLPDTIPSGSEGDAEEICKTGQTGSCIDLSVLTDDNLYLSSIPIDPSVATSAVGSGYSIYLDSSNNRVVVLSPNTEGTGGGAVAFAPSDISGLQLWLDAGHGITQNDGYVSTWTDRSGNENNAIQATAENQPLLVASGLNGEPTLSFDGVNDYVSFNEISDIRTVFWVLKEDDNPLSNYNFILGSLSAYDFHRGYPKKIWGGFTNNFITLGETYLNSTLINGGATDLEPNWSILSLVTTGNVKAENFVYDRTYGDSGQHMWDGSLAELIIYNTALSEVDRQKVETYLNTKYHIW